MDYKLKFKKHIYPKKIGLGIIINKTQGKNQRLSVQYKMRWAETQFFRKE